MIMINTQIPLNESHSPGMDVLYDNHVKHPYTHSRDYLLLVHTLYIDLSLARKYANLIFISYIVLFFFTMLSAKGNFN